MIYKWKTGTPEFYGKFDPQTVGENLEHIQAQCGSVAPDVLVQQAENVESPLHELFEWNDKIAAKGFRHLQAEEIAHSIISVIIKHGAETETEPQFLKVIAEPTAESRKYDAPSKYGREDSGPNGRPGMYSALLDLKRWWDRHMGAAGLSELRAAIRLQWPDSDVPPPASLSAIRLPAPERKPQACLDWCAVCGQDDLKIAANKIVEGVPLCLPCSENYADEPRVLKEAREWMAETK